MASPTGSLSKDTISTASSLSNVPPPATLPSFITSSTPATLEQCTILPVSQDSHEPSPGCIPSSPIPVKPALISSPGTPSSPSQPPKPVAAAAAPVTLQPLTPCSSSAQAPYSSSNAASQGSDGGGGQKGSLPSPGQEGDGWMGWIKGTVQSVGHRVAEKAKSSMDTMITTLDPQMKEFINSGGDMDMVVASDKEVKINPLKEAFQKTFGKATVSGFDSGPNPMAAQPLGFDTALRSAESRINFLRSSGKIHPQHPVVAVEGFVVELFPEYWVEMSLLLLDDPWHDVILQTYTQPIPLPEEFVQDLKSSTPDDYAMREFGFAKTIGQVASSRLQVHHTAWQEMLTGVTRREFILGAARVLAELYRTRLPTDVI